MKLVIEPIEVVVYDGVPARFRWRRRVVRVTEILDRWFWRGRWWLDPSLQGQSREYFRVRAGVGIYEICHRRGEAGATDRDDPHTVSASASNWHLSRRFD